MTLEEAATAYELKFGVYLLGANWRNGEAAFMDLLAVACGYTSKGSPVEATGKDFGRTMIDVLNERGSVIDVNRNMQT